jgi:hypothetical protein
MWNDTRIKDLNPGVASLLPEAEIIVAYITSAQTSVQASMQTLSAMVPEFNATVPPTTTTHLECKASVNANIPCIPRRY